MIYGSVCSGIEAASVAWKPLGWRPAFLSEIDPGARAVLQHRFSGVPLHGDFTTIQAGDYEPIDLLVGGTPCQPFSVAGLRGGLSDARGNLALEYLRLAERLRPRWLVWENVPGVLSSFSAADAPGDPANDHDGEIVETSDFASFLSGLQELGYGFAYRILDAQYLGVPQRRRRVILVGYLGDWRRAAQVLFERESLRGDPPPRRGAGTAVAALTSNGVGTCGADDNQAQAGHLIAFGGNNTSGPIDVAALNAGGTGRRDFETETFVATVSPPLTGNPYGDHEARDGLLVAHTLRAEGFDASEDGTGRGTPIIPVYAIQERAVSENIEAGPRGKGWQRDIAYTLEARHHAQYVAYRTAGDGGVYEEGEATAPLTTGTDRAAQLVLEPSLRMGVRRLTPLECERLQGFPDDWTLVPIPPRAMSRVVDHVLQAVGVKRPARVRMAPDGPRYKQLGNAMNVAVMRWIGERIAAVESEIMEEREAS